MTTTPAVLMVDTPEGNTIAIRFPSRDAARSWEDRHPTVVVSGCLDLVTQCGAVLDYGVVV
jgi:hypothetical protein